MKKDFDEYYNKIFKQYNELQKSLEEMSEEVSKGMVEPERLTNLKSTLQPVLTSFQTLSYIKYLLDKPARKNKRKRYHTNNKLLYNSGENTGDKVLSRNDNLIHNTKL